MTKKRYFSSWHLMIMTAIWIFIAEALIMFLISFLPPIPFIAVVLIDTFLLIILISPALYYNRLWVLSLKEGFGQLYSEEDGGEKAVWGSPTPSRSLIIVLVSVFFIESVIMISLSFLMPVSKPLLAFIDASLLAILVFPVLYLFLKRPMEFYIATLQKKEESLRESEEKYYSLFHNQMDAVFVFDAGTLRFENVNKAALSLFDYAEDEFLKLTFSDISGTREMVKASMENISRDGLVCERLLLHNFKKKDGTLFLGQLYSGNFHFNGQLKIFCTVHDLTRSKQMEEDIMQRTEELYDLAMKLTSVKERERKKFAEILHEDSCQNLVAVRIALENITKKIDIEDENLNQSVIHLFSLLDETIASMRILITGLCPATLGRKYFLKSIKWYITNVMEPKKIKVSFDVDKSVEDLSDELQHAIFRLIRECFQNILKHSSASEVDVVCKREDGFLKLEVNDNGIGFVYKDLNATSTQGIGLTLMQEWVMDFKGEFSVATQIGEGTKVVVELPVE